MIDFFNAYGLLIINVIANLICSVVCYGLYLGSYKIDNRIVTQQTKSIFAIYSVLGVFSLFFCIIFLVQQKRYPDKMSFK